MEDSHISDINIGNQNIDVFGVFDGHGGKDFILYQEEKLLYG